MQWFNAKPGLHDDIIGHWSCWSRDKATFDLSARQPTADKVSKSN